MKLYKSIIEVWSDLEDEAEGAVKELNLSGAPIFAEIVSEDAEVDTDNDLVAASIMLCGGFSGCPGEPK